MSHLNRRKSYFGSKPVVFAEDDSVQTSLGRERES